MCGKTVCQKLLHFCCVTHCKISVFLYNYISNIYIVSLADAFIQSNSFIQQLFYMCIKGSNADMITRSKLIFLQLFLAVALSFVHFLKTLQVTERDQDGDL